MTTLPLLTSLPLDVWGNDLDYDKKSRAMNRAAEKGLEPCERCGRGILPGKGWTIEVTGGGGWAILAGRDDDDVDLRDPGYMGCYVLGSECARRVPLAYRSKHV